MIEEQELAESVGVVIIGRNEGERLQCCLNSILQQLKYIVYVDSGSTDDSVHLASQLGADVLELNLSTPFTAARARNEGFNYLCKIKPELSFVQFVDGDCEIVDGWFEGAFKYLINYPDVAVVCGRRRERYPNTSIYNMLCDIEWDTPIGKAKACGGDAMMRVSAFQQVSGFNTKMIAGEEPELCVRIRQNGWSIWRLDLEMTLHDANITHFTQWWKRSVRGGYAYTMGSDMHGAKPERHWVRETNRIRLWGVYIPLTLLFLGAINFMFLYGLIVYLLQIVRLAIKHRNSVPVSWRYAFFMTIGKLPEAQGHIKYLWDKTFKTRSKIIEYKENN